MSRMKENDAFGQRMKLLEAVFDKQLRAYGEVCVRIDGRAFSTFTRGLEKPFDERITSAMVDTTKYLVAKIQAAIGYTQSDEISLVLGNKIPFDGRIQKMCSVLAGMATAKFMLSLPSDLQSRLPHFDCRVFEVPTRDEAANVILWRAMDAKKNAIQSVAQANFSHKQLQNKDQKAMLEMLKGKGIDFENAYPANLRLGTFIRKRNIQRLLTDRELERIPEKHRPTGPVVRSEYVAIDMPQFNLVKNRVEVIFDGADPAVEEVKRV